MCLPGADASPSMTAVALCARTGAGALHSRASTASSTSAGHCFTAPLSSPPT